MSLIIALQTLAKDKTARRIFLELSNRLRSRRYQDLLRFRQSFEGIDHTEFHRFFVTLEQLKVGKLTIGPSGALKRFEWIYSQASIARAALGLTGAMPSLFGEIPKRVIHRDKPNAPAKPKSPPIDLQQGTFESLLLINGEIVHIMGSIQAQVDLLSRLNAWDSLKQIRRVKAA